MKIIPNVSKQEKELIEKIQDEQDIVACEKAMKDYENNPKSHSLEEAKKILEIK